MGGGSQIANSILNVFENDGGELFTKIGVKEILVKNNKAYGVKLDNDQIIHAGKVISNAGLHNTFRNLVSKDSVPQDFFQKINNLRYSSGYFSLNLGFKKSSHNLALPKTNFWFYPSYDHDQNLKNYFEDQTKEIPISYVSFASAKDPLWDSTHPNLSTIDILGASSIKWFQKWNEFPVRNRGEEYNELKTKMARPYLDKLFEYMPQLRNELDHIEISTPLTMKSYCHYERGETYGLESSIHRYNKKWLRPKTPIKNLYLTGQDLVMGGVCGALASGAMTAIAISPLKSTKLLKSIGFFEDID